MADNIRRPRNAQAFNSEAATAPGIRIPADERAKGEPERRPRNAPRNFVMPGAWLFRKGRRAHAVPPAERFAFIFGGGLIWMWGAFLTNLYMNTMFPKAQQVKQLPVVLVPGTPAAGGKAVGFAGQVPQIQVNEGFLANFNFGALALTIVVSLIFMLVEVFVWKGGHSTVVWIIASIFLFLDVYMNIKGCMQLLNTQSWGPLDMDTGGAFVFWIGAGSALLPELFWSIGWKD